MREYLIKVGEALFGAHWQTEIAKKLEVDPRTVRRWIAGDHIQDGVLKDLKMILWERSKALSELSKELNDHNIGMHTPVEFVKQNPETAVGLIVKTYRHGEKVYYFATEINNGTRGLEFAPYCRITRQAGERLLKKLEIKREIKARGDSDEKLSGIEIRRQNFNSYLLLEWYNC